MVRMAAFQSTQTEHIVASSERDAKANTDSRAWRYSLGNLVVISPDVFVDAVAAFIFFFHGTTSNILKDVFSFFSKRTKKRKTL